MRVPLSWLRDFAPFDLDPKELGLVFDDLGMVVEGIEFVGGGLEGVVVARLLDIQPIEGLDRVRMTTVDAGDGEPLEVACGAWNIEPGQLVPLATIGTTLPNGMTIGRRKLKKVYSNGMLCSAVELALGTDSEGILILDPDSGAAPGTAITDALGIVPDVVYDLAIEGNRPDANCVAGVARDAAARLGLPFTLPSPQVPRAGTAVDHLASIANEAPELCPRFTATAITGVEIGPSPQWIQNRLTLAGMRPINNVVDASNYVMLELGQPTHPYDLDKLPGKGLRVRRATDGEIVRTLDDVDRVLGKGTDDCVICDAEGTPVGIGGIMGGASSEIDDATTNVLLEAANFDRMTIARTSKRLSLRTEASARFERGVDPEVIDLAVARFCELIGAGTVAPGMLDDRSGMRDRQPIRLRTARVNALLGSDLDDAAVAAYLTPIGFSLEATDPGVHLVTPPSFRPDVELEVDLVEEVARHHGYSNIARTVPRAPQVGTLSEHQRERRLVREILVGAGVSEAQTPSLVGPDDHPRAHIERPLIHASNPMIQEESILRASMVPGLLRAIGFNIARRTTEIALFEIGMVWQVPGADPADGLDAALPVEDEHLAVALAGADVDATSAKRIWDELHAGLRLADVDLEAAVEPGLHSTRTARVLVGGAPAGFVGEIDPSVLDEWGIPGRVAWLDVDLGIVLGGERLPLEQRPVSRFPSTDIDLAFVVPNDVAAGAVEKAVRRAGGDLLIDLRLFDVYRGDRVPAGTRGVAYRLRFNANDRTLTDEEIGAIREAVIAEVETSAGATLRT
ncbi:MAG TPA: phenylalanine--tRNA ligase subunit beta [Acidimicrobiales bacterium]|jgi:phenylalanyl-tRNA synthetase beta chain|nr:phenylalanine--tRNA ligase subunit beta [Acidimicrobiales bacterium]